MFGRDGTNRAVRSQGHLRQKGLIKMLAVGGEGHGSVVAGYGDAAADAFHLGKELVELVKASCVAGEAQRHGTVGIVPSDHRRYVYSFIRYQSGHIPEEAYAVIGLHDDANRIELFLLAPLNVHQSFRFVFVPDIRAVLLVDSHAAYTCDESDDQVSRNRVAAMAYAH